jgi:phosphate transport system ATP-binding protein
MNDQINKGGNVGGTTIEVPVTDVPVTDSVRGVAVRTSSAGAPSADGRTGELMLEAINLQVHYGEFLAVRDVNLRVHRGEITALIGPSGCGKSTIIRCFNRMNDLIPTARVGGKVYYRGIDMYGPEANAGEVRRRIGMVFQKPNPFPKSIFDNVAFGPRVNGKPSKTETSEIVERSLRRAALWDEVKDRLKQSAYSLSGGQQQRLCIARALAVDPDILLMDEPCSALDPIATAKIEDLMDEIKSEYPIVIVTHNMQQAARVSDRTAFFNTEVGADTVRPTGVLVEYDLTSTIFSKPSDDRTEQYISGRMG